MEIKKIKSPNHYSLSMKPVALVLHTTLGSLASTTSWFMNASSNVSAHFAVDRVGDIIQYVELNRGAWHAGRISNPSQRAKAILPKNMWGNLKNPNESTIGIEFVSGYDIDRDGVLESWEKLYTPKQMKAAVRLLLDVIEPETGVTFTSKNILTHKDTASYKPDLEIQRAMFISTLMTERERRENVDVDLSSISEPEPKEDTLVLTSSDKAEVKLIDGKVEITKI